MFRQSVFQKITTAVLVATLVVMLGPAAAYAQSLEAASVSGKSGSGASIESGGTPDLTTQATKTKAYVLKSITRESIYGHSDDSSTVYTSTYSFNYNTKGLLTKETVKQNGKTTVTRYSYTGDKLKKVVYPTSMATAKYDENGRLLQYTDETTAGPNSGINSSVYSFSYKSGKISSVCETQIHNFNGRVTTNTIDDALKYKNAKLVKTIRKAGDREYTFTYLYDEKGNVVKSKGMFGTSTCKNTYNSRGLLAKQTYNAATDNGTTKHEYTFTYEPIMVSKSLASEVNAQRWALQNRNLDYTLGPLSRS